MRAPAYALPGCVRNRSVGAGRRSTALTLRVRMGPRSGLTLLEVIVSLAIFLFAMVAIGRLITFGTDRAREIQGRASQLCQSKLAEVAAGIAPLQNADGTFDEAPDWHWSIECQENGIQSLWNVKVTVSRKLSDGNHTEAVLTQMVLDPAQRGSTLDANPLASTSTASSDTGSSGSSPSTGSSAPSVMGGTGSGGRGAGPFTGAGASPSIGPPSAAPRGAGAGMGGKR